MALLESAPAPAIIDILLKGLAEQSIEEVHRHPLLHRAIQPVLEAHKQSLTQFRRRMEVRDGVAFVDLADELVESFNKFIPYYYDRNVRYTVVLTRAKHRLKISVGSNPWSRPEPLINIAEVCERYGGGGHPVVGGISLPPNAIDRARQAAREIVATLTP
jgi:hypothetical protein